jgi:hypothetical protein
MVDGRTPLALDRVSVRIFLGDDDQLLVNEIGDCGCDRGQMRLAKSAAVLEDIAADKAKAEFVCAFGARAELSKAAIGAILREQPIERFGLCNEGGSVGRAAAAPRSNAGNKTVSVRWTAAS